MELVTPNFGELFQSRMEMNISNILKVLNQDKNLPYSPIAYSIMSRKRKGNISKSSEVSVFKRQFSLW